MPRPLVRLLLASVLVACSHAAVLAAGLTTPPPFNGLVPEGITLVGTHGGVPAGAVGTFDVIIRDLANNPVPGATVTIDLSLATDLSLCDDQLDPGVVLDCANRRVSAITDPAGRVVFTLVGGGDPAGARTLDRAGRIYWDLRIVKHIIVNTYDLDGAAGVGANDIALWLQDFASGLPCARGDYDLDGSLGANDLSQWLSAFGQGTQTASCAASCP